MNINECNELFREELTGYLQAGMSSRQIAALPNINMNYRTILACIHRLGLQDMMYFSKATYVEDFFTKIDTPAKAYILGFIVCDSYLTDTELEVTTSYMDRDIVYYIGNAIGAQTREDMTYLPEARRFPHATIHVCNRSILTDLKRCMGSGLKHDRHVPRVPLALERYLMLGMFDAAGCITWGRRKDRDRVWQKISFTSSYGILTGVQNILLKSGFASSIKPKGTENCYYLDFSAKSDVLRFLSYLYDDIPKDMFFLHRKYQKAQALRLELGEFGEGSINTQEIIPS